LFSHFQVYDGTNASQYYDCLSLRVLCLNSARLQNRFCFAPISPKISTLVAPSSSTRYGYRRTRLFKAVDLSRPQTFVTPLQAPSFAASRRSLFIVLLYIHTNRLNCPSNNLLPIHATHSSTHPLIHSPMPNQPYHYLTDFRGIPVTRILIPDG